MNGTPCLPGPGSYLDQDAELMMAFDLLAEVEKEVELSNQRREEMGQALT